MVARTSAWVVRWTLSALVLAGGFVPTASYGFGEVESLLSKEVRIEGARTTLTAVRERNLRLVTQLNQTLKDKREQEIVRVARTFGKVSQSIYDRSARRRAEMNASLQQFMLKYSSSPSIAQVYLRQAELFYNQASEKFQRDMEEYERIFAENEGKPGFVAPQEPQLKFDASIELYREFIQLFPTHPYMPEALYLLAFTLEENDQLAESIEVWRKLIDLDPRGPLAVEARYRYAESLFYESNFEEAEVQYRAAYESKDAFFMDKSLYKLAWTLYILERYEESIDAFVELLDMQSKNADPDSRVLSMRGEALKYVAISFTEGGGLAALEAWVKKMGGREYDLDLYKALGESYFEKTQFADAAQTWRTIIQRYPNYVQNPDIQERVVQTAGNIKGIVAALEERKAYTDLFGPGTTWVNTFIATDPELVRGVVAKAEQYQYEYATYYHARAQNNPGTYEYAGHMARAITAYSDFLARFPDASRTAEVLENLAEIRYGQKNWPEAGRLYRRLTQVLLDPENEVFKRASWDMLLAYRNQLQDYEAANPVDKYLADLTASTAPKDATAVAAERSLAGKAGARAAAPVASEAAAASRTRRGVGVIMQQQGAAGPKDLKQQTQGGQGGNLSDLPAPVMELIDTSEYYLQLYPMGQQTPKVLYSIGELLMKYRQYERARAYFLRFVRRFPADDYILDAIKYVARTYVEQGQFGRLVDWGREVLDSNLGRNPEIYKYFAGILSGALFKDAQKFESDKKFLAANRKYQELMSTYPESEYIDEAMKNIPINYQMAAQWDESSRSFKAFADKYPNDPFAPQAMFQVAVNYGKYMDFESAITAYETVVEKYPKTKEAGDALYNAANIAANLQMLSKAASLYLSYLQKFPGSKDEVEILFFAGDSYYKLGDYRKAIENYKKYLAKAGETEPDKVVQVYYNLGRAYEQLSELAEVPKWDKLVIDFTNRRLKEGASVVSKYAAEMAFKRAMPEFAKYQAIKLKGNVNQMSNLLTKKIQTLPQVDALFDQVILFKDQFYSSAALHMKGETFMELANTLFDAEVPEMSEEEMEEYRAQLDEQAYPIEEKALELWKANLNFAVSRGITNEWVLKSRAKLEKVSSNVARIKRTEDSVVSSSEFFYEFGSADAQTPEYKIAGARVIYPDLPEGSQNALQEKYTFAQFFTTHHKNLIAGTSRPPIEFSYNGTNYDFARLAQP